MSLDEESIRQQIPYYLTAEDRQVLTDELSAISAGGRVEYFLSPHQNKFKSDILQGDGWRGFQLFKFDSGARADVRGIVMSNTCDVDPGNPRDLPVRLMFAPIVKLAAFEEVLKKSGIKQERISEKIASIRAQKTTNMFFLPSGLVLPEDCVVRLDDVHSMPAAAHMSNANREKLFTLSNTGFYMFIFKLSVHFCRLQEKVNRQNTAA